jgi:hypothetical protein
MVNCCLPIQIPGSGLRLEERSDVCDCGSDKLTLYECPSCEALWAGRDVFWDHGTWYRKEYIRVTNKESFEALVASARVAPAVEPPVPSHRGKLTTGDIVRAVQIAVTNIR